MKKICSTAYPLVNVYSLLSKPWPSRNSGCIQLENGWIFPVCYLNLPEGNYLGKFQLFTNPE